MSTMSPSPRRHRTTALSSRSFLAVLAIVLFATGCRRGERETFATYFNGKQEVSLRYPSGWRTDEAEQEGIWYRYFLAPPAAPENKAAVSVTLLAGPLSVPLEEYAESYLAGTNVASSQEASGEGATGSATWTDEATAELKRIPVFVRGKAKRNTEKFAAERGVTQISLDTLYEAKVRLYVSADGPPETLYTEGKGAFEFARTASRLAEMMAGDYAAAMRLRGHFVPIEDFRARGGTSYNIVALKHAMRHHGAEFGPARPPMRALTDSERAEIDAIVTRLLEAEASECRG